jgi:hypothetical protein
MKIISVVNQFHERFSDTIYNNENIYFMIPINPTEKNKIISTSEISFRDISDLCTNGTFIGIVIDISNNVMKHMNIFILNTLEKINGFLNKLTFEFNEYKLDLLDIQTTKIIIAVNLIIKQTIFLEKYCHDTTYEDIITILNSTSIGKNIKILKCHGNYYAIPINTDYKVRKLNKDVSSGLFMVISLEKCENLNFKPPIIMNYASHYVTNNLTLFINERKIKEFYIVEFCIDKIMQIIELIQKRELEVKKLSKEDNTYNDWRTVLNIFT